ncbi:MXAN_5187 C-terminal domain-containing protein [Myxococcota bacterium]
MITRVIYLFVSTALLVGLGLMVVNGIATYDSTAVTTTQKLVRAGAVHAEKGLVNESRSMTGVVGRLVEERGLAADLRALTNAAKLLPPTGRIPDRIANRVAGSQDKLSERVGVWRERNPNIDGYCFVSDVGVVLLSDTDHFRQEKTVPIQMAAEETDKGSEDPASPESEEGTEQVGPSEEAKGTDLVLSMESNQVQTGTLIAKGNGDDEGKDLYWLTAAPIYQKTRLIGALIVESKVQSLPQTPGAEVTLVVDGEVVRGELPEGVDLEAAATAGDPLLVRRVTPPANVLGMAELGVGPMFVDAGHVGIWGSRFDVPGANSAFGLVVADVSPLYGELAGFQVTSLLLLAVVWLIHAMIILLGGWRLRAGANRIADFLGGLHKDSGQQRLEERTFPRELVRLVQLVNAAVGRTGQGNLKPLVEAPSLDAVLGAQDASLPPEEALDFKAISGSGSLGVAEDADKDADGYESLGDVAKEAAAEVDAVEQQETGDHPERLPGVPEALDAIEHLRDTEAEASKQEDEVGGQEAGEGKDDAAQPTQLEVMHEAEVGCEAEVGYEQRKAAVVEAEPVPINDPGSGPPPMPMTDPASGPPPMPMTDPGLGPAPMFTDPDPGPAPMLTDSDPGPAPMLTDSDPGPAPMLTDPDPGPAPMLTDSDPGPAPMLTDPGLGPAPMLTDPDPGPAPMLTDSDSGPAPMLTDPDPGPAPMLTDPDPGPAPMLTDSDSGPAPMLTDPDPGPAPMGPAPDPAPAPGGPTPMLEADTDPNLSPEPEADRGQGSEPASSQVQDGDSEILNLEDADLLEVTPDEVETEPYPVPQERPVEVALSKAPPSLPPPKDPELGDLLDEYAADATAVMDLSPELMTAMKEAGDAAQKEEGAPVVQLAVEGDAVVLQEGEGPRQGETGTATAEAEGEVSGATAAVELMAEADAALQQLEGTEKREGTQGTHLEGNQLPDTTVVDAVPPGPESENEHFREVFGQFVETRKTCGESISELTVEKFAAKLGKSRAAVMAKHKCSDVHFQVYVKNGKAALKAVPAR